MDSKERIIEICRYLDQTEITCKRCGVVHNVEDIVMDFKADSLGRLQVDAICPDCEKHIKYLPTAIDIKMPFGKYKDTMIQDLDYGYCVWMLNNTKMSGSLKKRFERRVSKPVKHVPKPVVVIPESEMSFHDRVKQLKIQYERSIDNDRTLGKF